MNRSQKHHKFLSLKQKCEILGELDKGKSATFVVSQFGVGKSTVTCIKQNSTKILAYSTQTESGTRKRKTLKMPEMPKMEKALFNWFCKQRERHAPISSVILSQKAMQLNGIYKECQHFNASRGWIQKFRKRHGVRILKITGEKLSSATNQVAPFILEFHKKIKDMDLTKDQNYNADETGLYWRLLPDKTLVCLSEKNAPGRKVSKERVTFLACCNGSGEHKIRPLVIGNSANPRAYKATKNPRITTEIFENWFHQILLPEVG